MHHDTSYLNNSAGISEDRLYAACTHITYVLFLPQTLNLNQTMRKLSKPDWKMFYTTKELESLKILTSEDTKNGGEDYSKWTETKILCKLNMMHEINWTPYWKRMQNKNSYEWHFEDSWEMWIWVAY